MTAKNNKWFATVGGIVVVLVFIGGGLTQLGVLPWATASNVKALIALKNQDNEWYRELSVDVAKLQTEIEHLKKGQDEIKDLLRRR